MLELKNIVKCYQSGDTEVHALNGVSLRFRPNEFVSILGPSGCGKTTLLNIVGGLDRYSEGDLIINGKSTKDFRDRDWDTYRNHSIGFVFQSYNLIPHQTVLSNVELALTLSGVSRTERRARAIEALKKVGLGDQLHKKPNQMSGGQMQRVAIARALVNNPDILLADEPTGALDTQTSIQIMDLLKEVAQDRLVIMVTHNPELAEEYSTRIVRLQDGEVIGDSAPVSDEEMSAFASAKKKEKKESKGKKSKTSMSFFTALSLSKNNLLTKKGRTVLTSFAGSIGIIGIALILALSNGIQTYIDTVQEDTLSTYPLSIEEETADYSAMLATMMQVSESKLENPDPNKIYVDDSMGTMMSAMTATIKNDLTAFKAYLEQNRSQLDGAVSDIKYRYSFDLQVYTEDGKTQVSPTEIFDNMGDTFAGISDMIQMAGAFGVMSEMIDNQTLLDQQYELVGEESHWPTSENEIVLVVGPNNMISKMTLYMLGVLDQGELEELMQDLFINGKGYESSHMQEYDIQDFLGKKFLLVNTSQYFTKTGRTYEVNGKTYPIWEDMRVNGHVQDTFVKENGVELKICGIVRPKAGSTATSITGALGYTKELTNLVLKWNTESEIIAQQKETPDHNVLNGSSFERIPYTRDNIDELIERVGTANMKRFYGIMTAMILEDPQYAELFNVNADSIAMFISTMEDEPQAERIAELLSNAVENDAPLIPDLPQSPTKLGVLLQTVQSMGAQTGGLANTSLNADNLVELLPLLSDYQVMVLINGLSQQDLESMNPNGNMPLSAVAGLKDICSAEKMAEFYKTMNENISEWQINDKSMRMILSMPQMTDEMFAKFEETLYGMVPDKDATYESMLKDLGDAVEASPSAIHFYAKDFESKEKIESFIKTYNESVPEKQQIQYTDMIGQMMSSVSLIINVISYVLIAFVSISLVVSSIMIGIITYISVLERTKEIGILRSIGASKKDISRVFNAETLIVGFTAGLIGVLFTVLLTLPVNAIIQGLSGIPGIAAILPWKAAIVLVLISMFLTFIAGLIPSGVAAKKDPVEALRTE